MRAVAYQPLTNFAFIWHVATGLVRDIVAASPETTETTKASPGWSAQELNSSNVTCHSAPSVVSRVTAVSPRISLTNATFLIVSSFFPLSGLRNFSLVCPIEPKREMIANSAPAASRDRYSPLRRRVPDGSDRRYCSPGLGLHSSIATTATAGRLPPNRLCHRRPFR